MFPLSGGLWSVNRGLARDRDGDYRHLSNADRPLREWCDCFVAACNDQATS
jgi:hypothetical protein